MTTAIQELCPGSGRTWKLGVNRHCPVCTKSSATIAKETSTTGNAGTIPRHPATTR
jgi:hypothetical protein